MRPCAPAGRDRTTTPRSSSAARRSTSDARSSRRAPRASHGRARRRPRSRSRSRASKTRATRAGHGFDRCCPRFFSALAAASPDLRALERRITTACGAFLPLAAPAQAALLAQCADCLSAIPPNDRSTGVPPVAFVLARVSVGRCQPLALSCVLASLRLNVPAHVPAERRPLLSGAAPGESYALALRSLLPPGACAGVADAAAVAFGEGVAAFVTVNGAMIVGDTSLQITGELCVWFKTGPSVRRMRITPIFAVAGASIVDVQSLAVLFEELSEKLTLEHDARLLEAARSIRRERFFAELAIWPDSKIEPLCGRLSIAATRLRIATHFFTPPEAPPPITDELSALRACPSIR
jgi:hypothetical protein